MTARQKTSLANAAVAAFASSIIVPSLLIAFAVSVLGKRLNDLGPVMLAFWALLVVALALGFFARDTSKGKFVLVAGVLLPFVMVALKLIAMIRA
jgi:hypothetical protein